MSTNNKKIHKISTSILSNDLRRHYEKHGVTGIERFISNKTDSNVLNDENEDYCDTKCASNLLSRATSHSSPSSRFIRFNPRYNEKDTLQILSLELPDGIEPIPILWISKKLQFYAIPCSFSLVKSKSFQSGRIYGMDISSGAAVAALLLDEYDCDRDKRDSGEYQSKVECDIGEFQGKAGDIVEGTTNMEGKSSFRVLDLCCAPGLKTCAIADLLSMEQVSLDNDQNAQGNKVRIIGVDISHQRIQLCKNIITKYHIDKSTSGHEEITTDFNKKSSNEVENQGSRAQLRISLYCADGTTFGNESIDANTLIFDSIAAREEEDQKGSRKRMNKSARARQRKRLRSLATEEYLHDDNGQAIGCAQRESKGRGNSDKIVIPLFDRVLVDAECSTDGAIRHIQVRHQKSQAKESNSKNDIRKEENYTHNHKLTDADALANLVDLQKRLLQSGFRLLKPGGTLVYSTCSLATEQNENVVSWLLEMYKDEAYVIPVMFLDVPDDVKNENAMIYEGSLKGSVRFHPNVMNPNDTEANDLSKINHYLFGGGFFLVKIGRKRKRG